MDDNAPDNNNVINEQIRQTDLSSPEVYAGPEVMPSINLRPADRPLWTGWDVLLILVITIAVVFFLSIIALVGAIVLQGVSSAKVGDSMKDPRIIIPVQTVAYLFVFWCMVMMVKRGEPISFWRAISWKWPKRWFVFLGGGMALTLVIPILSKLLTIPKQLPIDEMMKTTTNAYIITAFGILVAPLLEELFFRGMLYPLACERVLTVVGAITLEILLLLPAVVKHPRSGWLVLVLALLLFNIFLIGLRVSGRHTKWFRPGNPTTVGKYIGLGVTAFGFAMIHGSQLASAFGPLLILLIVGLVLTGVRAKTGSVAASVLMHIGYNATLFTVLWFLTDRFRHMEKAAGMMILGR